MRHHRHKVTTVRVGGEPFTDPVWKQRIDVLSKLFDGPMTILELATKARPENKWDESMVKNILAAGDGKNFYYSVNGFEFRNVVSPGGRWYLRGHKPQHEVLIENN